MSAKSYTKTYFGGSIRITPLFQTQIYSYLLNERVLSPFREGSRYTQGNVENIKRQTLYEMVTTLLTPGSDTGGFLCVIIFASLSFVAI